MADITRDQPGDAKRRRIQAQARSLKCADCGLQFERTLATTIKADGRKVCPDCFQAILVAVGL